MGLGVTLSNALSGMRTTQDGLAVLSRNVANAGSPGYHRQSVTIQDMNSGSSTYAQLVDVQRAFSAALQRANNQETAGLGYADVRSTFLSRLETTLGKPGDPNSLDTIFQNFQKSMSDLAISPEDYATRALAVGSAQTLAQSLNGVSNTIQGLRGEAENQIASHVDELNSALKNLQGINNRLSDPSVDQTARASMLDQRDRLITTVSDLVDVKVSYRNDGTVSLMTSAGLGLLDKSATNFEFKAAGSISPSSLYNIDPNKNGVGVLTAITPSGLKLDVFAQNIIQSGRIAALVDIRDKTLVQAQAQVDQIAGAISKAANVNVTAGTPVTGPPNGFDVDTTNVQSGNDISFSYTQSGKTYNVKVVRVEDTALLPMDYVTPGGERVVGLSFGGGASAVASALNAKLSPGIVLSATGSTLKIRDNGGVTSNMLSAVSNTTSTATQGQGLAVSLFTDLGDAPVTGSIDGGPQIRGLAGRISVNSQIVNDNTLLVQSQSGASLGDPSRVNYILDRLKNAQFTSDKVQTPELGDFRLTGSVQSLVQQTLNYQGGQISAANDNLSTQKVSQAAVQQRMDSAYGVNVDEEMARLMELQNSYAASARVVSIVQQLINSLMQI